MFSLWVVFQFVCFAKTGFSVSQREWAKTILFFAQNNNCRQFAEHCAKSEVMKMKKMKISNFYFSERVDMGSGY